MAKHDTSLRFSLRAALIPERALYAYSLVIHNVVMGRKSRAKKERQGPDQKVVRRRAIRAELRGRSVPPTRQAFVNVSSSRGTKAVIEALISRHNQRWENVAKRSGKMGDRSVETLHVLFPSDVALRKLGSDKNRMPSNFYGDWPDNISWGLDGVCASVRMILAGNILGASALSRSQLERWSHNLISNCSEEQGDEELWSDFLTRVWNIHHEDCPPAGATWDALSEILHGRGQLLPLARWSAQNLCASDLNATEFAALAIIDDANRLALRQIRHCIAQLGSEHGWPQSWAELIAFMPDQFPADIEFALTAPALWPLTIETLEAVESIVVHAGGTYGRDVLALASGKIPTKKSYSERAIEGWWWRRARSVQSAMDAFALERKQLGSSFDPQNLRRREWNYILIAEIAALLSSWTEAPVSDAFCVASEALRGAFWLWLEDDERAMTLARTVLEQTARARTWRTKAAKAQQIEDRGSRASTRDWIEKAGWRRLSIVNRSLGEFAHVSAGSKWSGAREALAEFQAPFLEDTPSHPLQTGRGSALNACAYLMGFELRFWSEITAPEISEVISMYLPLGNEDASESDVEAWLNHAWSLRAVNLGVSDFRASNDASAD